MVNLGSSFEQTMVGPSPQCYIPSHKVIGPLVLEKKIFEGFLLYMRVAATLAMWPRPREQIFVLPSHLGSIWNLVLIGQAVLEKIFENGGRWTTDGRRADDVPWLYYKLTYEPKGSGELKSLQPTRQLLCHGNLIGEWIYWVYPWHEARSTMWALAARAIYWYQILHIAYTNRYQYTARAASAHIVERASELCSSPGISPFHSGYKVSIIISYRSWNTIRSVTKSCYYPCFISRGIT